MYGGIPYAGGPYAGDLVDAGDIPADGEIHTAVEVAFTTDALSATPAFVDIGLDCRMWDAARGRSGELERFPPGRATVVLDNENGDYDSHNASGPWYGHLKPNRRLRIRETLNGVTYTQFDGFVDRWGLDYANVGKDATATVTATDGTKILARTELVLSAYHEMIVEAAPDLYWRLDESKNAAADATLLALNSGTLGGVADGGYVGPPELDGEALVVNDPGGSMGVVSDDSAPGTGDMGVSIAGASFALNPTITTAWVSELWCIPRQDPGINGTLFCQRAAGGSVDIHCYYTAANTFVLNVFADGTDYSVNTSPTTYPPHARYHIVCKVVPGESVKMWVNGVLHDDADVMGPDYDELPGLFSVGTLGAGGGFNWDGSISHFSVWRGAAATAVDQAFVDAHYAAGTHPWQGDTPAARLERLADLAGLPANMRDFDPGLETLQSVDFSTGLLDNVYKVGETEFGLLFWSRDGQLTLVDRTALFGRLPVLTYGDGAGEAGYRDLGLEDGEGALRNTATISRLQGVAKTAVDAGSVADYGRFTYTLEGLLHDDDDTSQNYANLIVAEYGEMRRRVSRLQVGPPVVGEEDVIWPAVLLPELGDAVTVAKGDFEQVAAIEGIHHVSRPGEDRTATFTLSPEFAVRALEDEEVATLGYEEVTANQGSITGTAVDLTGLSADVVVGANRRVKITAQIGVLSSVDNDFVRLDILEGAAFQNLGQRRITTSNTILKADAVITPSAGAHTYKLQLSRTVGTGTVTMNASAAGPAFILVEDIGPV